MVPDIPARVLTKKEEIGKVVVIDPGHGGHDLGEKDERGTIEKDFNLRLAKILTQIFQQTGNKVIMTRTEDIAVSLPKRVALANRQGAHLFISLHRKNLNGCCSKGAATYYYSRQNHRLAQVIQAQIDKIYQGQNWESKMEKFYVLKYTNMPAVLIETISADICPLELAQAISTGVRTYWEEE